MKRLLLLGFLDSPHFARWVIHLIDRTTYDVVLFSTSPGRRINPSLSNVIEKYPNRVEIAEDSPRWPWLTYLLDFLMPGIYFRRRALERCLSRNNFDLVHFFEMQHSGYLLETVRLRPDVPYAYSCYGSDIYWFWPNRRHRKRIKSALSFTSLVFYECDRDLGIMKTATKSNAVFVKTINSGGLKHKELKAHSDRDTILIKGYSNKWGRALWVLWQLKGSIKSCREKYQVVIYSCDYHVPPLAYLWGAFLGVKVTSYAKGRLTHDETLSLFDSAIVHIAVSRSDGVPSSTLEAMQGGAIPIQSKTACMEDWIDNGRTGYLIEQTRTDLLLAFNRILSEPEFRAKAARENHLVITKRHNSKRVGVTAAEAYRKLLEIKS